MAPQMLLEESRIKLLYFYIYVSFWGFKHLPAMNKFIVCFDPSHYFCGKDHKNRPQGLSRDRIKDENARKRGEPVGLGVFRVSHPLSCHAGSFSTVCRRLMKWETCLSINGSETKINCFQV